MRTIKFRGKQITTGKWLYGDLMHDSENGCYIYPMDAEGIYKENKVIPETVGQFTGLLDKNGKEIYEGDIVKIQWNIRPFGIITWHDNGYFFIDDSFGQLKHFSNDFTTLGEMLKTSARIEVIGNIHDNPELLEK